MKIKKTFIEKMSYFIEMNKVTHTINTAQIDEVIRQKEKLIELLKERKQIVINDAVTKGLDKDFEPLSVTKNGIVPQLDNTAKSNDDDNRKLVRKGDFIINSRFDRKGSSGLSKLDGSVSLINIVLKPININSDFSHILLKSNRFIVADLWTTRFWDMKSIMLAIPPKQEQLQIVEYIETQTPKIDIAIELQLNYIKKLKEYKATLIESVVTGKVRVA